MKLVIDISASDKTNSAVTSITDATAIAEVQQMVLGDTEPLDITFTDSAASPMASPSWAGAAGYSLVVGLGTMDANALLNYTTSSSFVAKTGGWTGSLPLNTDTLRQAMNMAVNTGGGWAGIATDPRARNARPNWAYFWLQIQVIDPTGAPRTYAILRAPVVNRELPPNAVSVSDPNVQAYSWLLGNLVVNGQGITGLSSATADSTKLGGKAAGTSGYPVGTMIALNFSVVVNDGAGAHAGTLTLVFQLVASTHGSSWPLWGRPYNYDDATNQAVWRLLFAFLDTLPAAYNASTGKFHYLGVSGAAGAVFTFADQTGTAAPA